MHYGAQNPNNQYHGFRDNFWRTNSRAITQIIKEEFEDTKGVIRIRTSKKNSCHRGQKKKYKRTNNDLQNIHIKLKIE